MSVDPNKKIEIERLLNHLQRYQRKVELHSESMNWCPAELCYVYPSYCRKFKFTCSHWCGNGGECIR